MSVGDAVTKALDGKSGPLVAVAFELARRLDDPDEKSPAPVAKELRATLTAIADEAPAVEDPLDEIRARRSARTSKPDRGAAAAGS